MKAAPFDQKGFNQTCGLHLAIARKIHGITQAKLAERLGVTRSQLANIEAGRSRVYVDVIWRAAIVMGLNVTKLIPQPANRRAK